MQSPVQRARFRFDSGAGRFEITDTTAELLQASVRSTIGRYHLSRTTRDSVEDLFMELEGDSPVGFGRVKNSVELRLNTAPLWELNFDVGATELKMDLVPYRIRELMVDCGASSVNLTLGDRADSTRIVIDAGASSVRLRVPRHCGCRVEMDAGMSSKRLREFMRVAEDVYETENYRESSRRILIILDAGVSSIRIDRYRLEHPAEQW
jgi:hypothetical protein